jgi:CRISPR system Cascade subunit CasB
MSSTTEKKWNEFSDSFITRLENLVAKKDRGALAFLRRGLGKDVPFEAFRFMPFQKQNWQEEVAILIGPLFAYWHQREDAPRNAGENENLGSSMLKLVHTIVREGSDREDAMKRVERRFGAMLNCNADDLKHHLRHAVSLLKSKDVPINWRLLCDHVQQWGHEDRWVQRAWARSFWASGTDRGEVPEAAVPYETTGKNDTDSVVE